MLNEVKHLVLRTGGCFLLETRFFVALLLRMTLSRNLSFRAKREIPMMPLLLDPSLKMRGFPFLNSHTSYCVVSGISRRIGYFAPSASRNDTDEESFPIRDFQESRKMASKKS